MKRIFPISAILVIIVNLSGYGQLKSYPNPSVVYIEKMGYTFSLVRDALGNEQGTVIFPDGSKADAWAFLQGKAGQQYSYCTKKGYSTESIIIDHGSWKEETSVCTKVDKNGQKINIPMLELMEQNKEPLIEKTVRSKNISPAEDKFNTNLKSATDFPTTFDWRSYDGHSYIGPILNQGSCGSCYSFSANASAEGVYNFATGNYDGNCADLSESFIIWCLAKIPDYGLHFYGCSGADYTYYELKALVDSGVTYEANFPYQQNDPGTCTHWNNPRIRFNDWFRVGCSDIEGIKNAIMTYGVVDAAVYVTNAFQGYTQGVFSDNNTSCTSSPCYDTPTNHGVALVGWGVDPVEGEYWILRNSWGSNWGEDGYMKIKTTSARVACEVAYLTYVPVDEGPPIATTIAATGITTNGATLNGTVSARNLPTTVTFQYGLTTSYQTAIDATPYNVTGDTNIAVSASLTGIEPNTTYHFRVKAVNSLGTTYGNDLTFHYFYPDLSPNITVEPSIMHGVQHFDIIAQVTELVNTPTNGLITVLVPKDIRWVLDGEYEQNATSINGKPVDNSVWTFSSDETYYKFTTLSVIPASSFSKFGIKTIWSAGFTTGAYTLTSQIISGSGGETRIDNNVDAEELVYFIY